MSEEYNVNPDNNTVTDPQETRAERKHAASVLLRSPDEFHNSKTEQLIKLFHSKVKQQLVDSTRGSMPDSTTFVLLTSSPNSDEYKCIWANNPNLVGESFAKRQPLEEEEEDVDHMLRMGNELKKSDAPIIVPIKEIGVSHHSTDANGRHFGSEALKYSKTNYWLAGEEFKDEIKAMTVTLQKLSKVKYIGISFYDPTNIKQVFDVLYRTESRDEKGNPILKTVVTEISNFQEGLEEAELQFIEFEEPVLTREIYLIFKSDVAAVNFIMLIENTLSEEALAMFSTANPPSQQ